MPGIDKYSCEIRKLADDYFNQQIDFFHYRTQRNILLNKLEEELNGSIELEVRDDKPSDQGNLVNKVLELIRRNSKEIISE